MQHKILTLRKEEKIHNCSWCSSICKEKFCDIWKSNFCIFIYTSISEIHGNWMPNICNIWQNAYEQTIVFTRETEWAQNVYE